MSALPFSITDAWQASLQLQFTHDGSRTVLASRKHVGPLLVQRPFYPEADVCHVYVIHPPGGIVGGDQLRLEATLTSRAHVVITTPAATKFYRSLPDRCAVLHQSLHVNNATLEWLPQETILFRDARATTTTRVTLDTTSRFIGWELNCYGRPASNERFDRGFAHQNFELWVGDQPVLLDHLRINGEDRTMGASWGLAGETSLGTLLAYPATNDDLELARTQSCFASSLVDRVLCCRALTSNADEGKRAFVALWRALRPPILGRQAVLPRIWAT